MFDHKHYVPILKAKQGELAGLNALPPNVRITLTPLIELGPPTSDGETKTCDARLATAMSRIAKAKAAWSIIVQCSSMRNLEISPIRRNSGASDRRTFKGGAAEFD